MAKRTLLIGIDSGTQSTKALVVDARSGKVLGSGSSGYDLIAGLPPGAKEQHPHTWREATAKAIKVALKEAKAGAGEVVAIGVSGQQHGFVPLDKAGEVIRPAKLWCDTATAAECAEITAGAAGTPGRAEFAGPGAAVSGGQGVEPAAGEVEFVGRRRGREGALAKVGEHVADEGGRMTVGELLVAFKGTQAIRPRCPHRHSFRRASLRSPSSKNGGGDSRFLLC